MLRVTGLEEKVEGVFGYRSWATPRPQGSSGGPDQRESWCQEFAAFSLHMCIPLIADFELRFFGVGGVCINFSIHLMIAKEMKINTVLRRGDVTAFQQTEAGLFGSCVPRSETRAVVVPAL